jgi:EpsI family protein
MNEPKTLLIPVFLASQALFVHWTGTLEKPPAKPDLDSFPAQVGPWTRTGELPVETATLAQLGADRVMNSMYTERSSGDSANVFVAWFQSQRAGASQPHSPQVCLPASGWVPESNSTIDISTRVGTIAVNRYVIANGIQRAVVLYWYQTPRRVVAGEWAAKFWLMVDALRDRRTDTSLVRVTTWVNGTDVAAATTAATDLSQKIYPLLRDTFPR